MKQRAFTLIELSIVLVIIGLIVGGVLVGKDLIATGKRVQAVKDIASFNVATLTFKNKYNCLPGDCTSAQAAQFGLSAHPLSGTTNNGNNNGSICERGTTTEVPVSTNSQRFECFNYWWYLSQAGLINWTTSDTTANCSASVLKYGESTPPVPFRKASPVGTNNASSCVGWLIVGPTEMNIGANAFINKNHAFLSMGGYANSGAITSGTQMTNWYASITPGSMSPADAFYLDTKLDDGLPNSGLVRAIGFYQDSSQPASNRDLTEPFRGAAGTVVCINTSTSPNSYNIQSAEQSCNLSIEAEF